MTENPKKASPLSSIGVLSSLTEVASASSPRSGTHQSSSLFSSVSGTSSTSNSSAIGENSERQRVKTEQNEGKNDPKKVEKMFMSPIFVAPSPRTLFGGLDSPFPSLAVLFILFLFPVYFFSPLLLCFVKMWCFFYIESDGCVTDDFSKVSQFTKAKDTDTIDQKIVRIFSKTSNGILFNSFFSSG